MKYIRISDEAHREAKIAAAAGCLTLEDWASLALRSMAAKGAQFCFNPDHLVKNGREAQEQR